MKYSSVRTLTRLSRIVLVMSGLSLGAAAWAAPPVSYDQLSLRYINQDLDDDDCQQDGLQVGGTKDLGSDVFALASLTDVSGNNACGSTTTALGVGAYTGVDSDASLYGTLAYENTSVDFGSGDSGLVAAAGVRGYLRPQLETRLELAHHTAFDGETVINGVADYWFNSDMAVIGQVSLGSDTTTLAAGIRMNF